MFLRQKSFMAHVEMMLVCCVNMITTPVSFSACRIASDARVMSSHALAAWTMCITRPVAARGRYLRESYICYNTSHDMLNRERMPWQEGLKHRKG